MKCLSCSPFRTIVAVLSFLISAAAPSLVVSQDPKNGIQILYVIPTQRYDVGMELANGSKGLDEFFLPFNIALVPGMRATVAYEDSKGANRFAPELCTSQLIPHETELCGYKVITQFIYSSKNPDGDEVWTQIIEEESPLFSVNSLDANRIDFQVPVLSDAFEVPESAELTINIFIETEGGRSELFYAREQETPGFYAIYGNPQLFIDRWGRPIITREDGTLVNELRPAFSGEKVTLLGTGFGQSQPSIGVNTQGAKDFTISGLKLELENNSLGFFGLAQTIPIPSSDISAFKAPGYVGVDAVTFVVPTIPSTWWGGEYFLRIKREYTGPAVQLYQKVFLSPSRVALYIDTVKPKINLVESRFRGVDYLPTNSRLEFSQEVSSSKLVPGSYAIAYIQGPGCWGSLKGELAVKFPKPTEFCDLALSIKGDNAEGEYEAPIYGVSAEDRKVLFQVPTELHGAETGFVSLFVNGERTSPFPVEFAAMDFLPLRMNGYSINTSVAAGDSIEVDGIGLGQSTNPIPTNHPGGPDYSFDDVEVYFSGAPLSAPIPAASVTAKKEADDHYFATDDFQFYFGSVVLDRIGFTIPSGLQSGVYTPEVCRSSLPSSCKELPRLIVEGDPKSSQLCVSVLTPSGEGLGGATVNVDGVGTLVTTNRGTQCRENIPLGQSYTASASLNGYVFSPSTARGVMTTGVNFISFIAEKARAEALELIPSIGANPISWGAIEKRKSSAKKKTKKVVKKKTPVKKSPVKKAPKKSKKQSR